MQKIQKYKEGASPAAYTDQSQVYAGSSAIPFVPSEK